MATNPQGTVSGYTSGWQPTTAPVRKTNGGTRSTAVGTTVKYTGPSPLPTPSATTPKGVSYVYNEKKRKASRKNRKASRKNRKASRKNRKNSRRH